MLDKKTFINGLNKLIVAYPNWNLDVDNAQVLKIWFDFFKHMDNKRFDHMINEYIDNQRFNPTVAGLKECDTFPRKSITQLRHEQEMKEYEEQLRRERENART